MQQTQIRLQGMCIILYMVIVTNDQPGPHDHQLGAERKQSIPMKSYHHLPLFLTNTTPSREKALQAKPKHITLVSFCQHFSTSIPKLAASIHYMVGNIQERKPSQISRK